MLMRDIEALVRKKDTDVKLLGSNVFVEEYNGYRGTIQEGN